MKEKKAKHHQLYIIPGFFGFTTLGDVGYWEHVRVLLPELFERAGLSASAFFTEASPTSSLSRRTISLVETIERNIKGEDTAVHLIGHSTGGLDARLMVSPGVKLRTTIDVEKVAARVKSVVTIATPHYGAPMAEVFTSMMGKRLLQVVSLATIYVTRFGGLPISMLARLAGVLAVGKGSSNLSKSLLDQLFTQLLSDFNPDRREEIKTFFAEVGNDQSLLPQLAPENMDLFNTTAADRPGVAYASVVTRAKPPGMRSTLSTGLAPYAQAMHALYHALHRLAGPLPYLFRPALTDIQTAALHRGYPLDDWMEANDGVVPTASQVWGEVIHTAQADHHDIIGHFKDNKHAPPHYDWLVTGSKFNRHSFEAAWTDIVDFVASAEDRGRKGS